MEFMLEFLTILIKLGLNLGFSLLIVLHSSARFFDFFGLFCFLAILFGLEMPLDFLEFLASKIRDVFILHFDSLDILQSFKASLVLFLFLGVSGQHDILRTGTMAVCREFGAETRCSNSSR